MVKNCRMEFRVSNDMKENFILKANSLNLNYNEFFELLCTMDLIIKESDLYGVSLKDKFISNNNERIKNLRFNTIKEISKGEKDD